MNTEEVWKAVDKYPNYHVSTHGRLKRVTPPREGIKVPQKTSTGYVCFHIKHNGVGKNITLARMMAETFLGDRPSDRHQAAHNDGNKLNNHISNIRWASPEENQDDRRVHGTMRLGEKVIAAKLTDDQIREIRAKDESTGTLSKMYGVSQVQIWRIKKFVNWKHI